MMTLLQPALLALTVLIAVPLAMHLFARARPRRMEFPSLRWLSQVQRTTSRMRKPKDWLLLLLRTLAVAALVSAFLQPVWFAGARMAAPGEMKTVVIVIDRTASMNFVEHGRSRFSRAVQIAEQILDAAGGRTLANVVWLDAVPEAVFPEPAVSLDALRQQVLSGRSTMEDGDTAAALRQATSQLGSGEGARELHLISDFQITGWGQLRLEVSPAVKVFKVAVADTVQANQAITSLAVQPARPVSGTETRVLCRVRNYGSSESRSTVQLAAGETRQSRAVTVPAWGEAVVEFRVPAGSPGLQTITASLPDDLFPADDKRSTVLEVREGWQVRTLGSPQDEGLAMWKRALSSLGWLKLEAVTDQPEVVVAVRPEAEAAASLRAAAESGALVICQPGAEWSGTPWMAFWNAGATEAGLSYEERRAGRDQPWTLKQGDDSHPIWNLFRGGDYGDPAAARVWQRLHVKSTAGEALLRFGDEVPAVMLQKVGKGWLVFWNMELGEKGSDWVQQPVFLAFLGELLLHYGDSASQTVRRDYSTAEPVRWTASPSASLEQVRLLAQSGDELAAIPDIEALQPGMRSREPLDPGLYRWSAEGVLLDWVAVSFPAEAESDPRFLMPGELDLAGTAIPAATAATLLTGREGHALWPYLVAAALFLLVVESSLATLGRKVEGGASA